jgi:hypothetical protein
MKLPLLVLLMAFGTVHAQTAPCALAGQWRGDTVMLRTPVAGNRAEIRRWEAERTRLLQQHALASFAGTDSVCWLFGLNLAFDDTPRGIAARYAMLNDSTLQFRGPISTAPPDGHLLVPQNISVRCERDTFTIVATKDGKEYGIVFRRIPEAADSDD